MSVSPSTSWPYDPQPICLVTGAARGLGIEVAAGLADRGAVVLIGSRDAAAAATAAQRSVQGELRPLPGPLHIDRPADIAAAASLIRADFGRLDVLVNNAAAYADWSQTATTADLTRAREVMETNLFGTWRMVQAFLPLLRASRHPRLVNVASGAGSHEDPEYGLAARAGAAASYAISKAAVLALTSILSAELVDTPVIVNAVDPGLTATWPGAEATGARSANDSARGVIWAATLPDNGPRGGFYRDATPLAW